MTEETTGQTAETGAVEQADTTSLDAALNTAPDAPAKPAKEPKTPKTEAGPEAKPENEQPFWYRKEIEKERKARQAAERRAEELAASNGHKPAELPHPGQDPQGFYSHFEQQRLIDRLERSEDRFIDKHGDSEFEATKDWLATRPDIEEAALKQRHPWAYAHTVYQREKLAAEIGDDPATWREKETARIRAEVEAQLAEEGYAPPPGMAAQSHRIPSAAAAQRSASPRSGFTGPTPIGDALKRK